MFTNLKRMLRKGTGLTDEKQEQALWSLHYITDFQN
jgi:hypothetical protein